MLNPDMLKSLREGIAEGHVQFRFEGLQKGTHNVKLWIEFEARAKQSGRWDGELRMGDGTTMQKHFTAGPDLEKNLSLTIEAMWAFVREKGTEIPRA